MTSSNRDGSAPDPARAIGEVREHLDSLQRRFGASPDDHLRALYLLALEREQIVAVSYDEEILGRRIRALEVDEETRDILHHALRWVWKEEQMHAMYIRGALLQVGGPLDKLGAVTHQLAGAIGGWSTAVLHHCRWREAPLSRMLATTITGVASVVGKLPKSVKNELRYVTFSDYCGFAAAAEVTAVICWQRIAELAVEHGYDERLATAFARMSADENSHNELFTMLREAFDQQDRLRPGWSADRLVARLVDIGDYMLPRRFRPDVSFNPLGAGGQVTVLSDEHSGDGALSSAAKKRRSLRDVVALSKLEEALDAHLATIGQSRQQCRIAIKPTFMMGYNQRDPSCITDPELVHELCLYLKELGCGHISILEGRNHYDWYFDGREVEQVAEYFGYNFEEATLVNTGKDMVEHTYHRGSAQHHVPAAWRDADFRISFGKMRSHPVEQVYLTLAQLEGMAARCEEFVFVDRKAHSGAALMTLVADFPPQFALLDAYDSVPDGLLGMLASPAPHSPKRLYAGRDALSVDAVAARHMGLHDLDESQFLETAIDWYGDPRDNIEVQGCDEPLKQWRSPCHNELSALLSLLSFPVYMLLSGRGSLFLPEMDPAAFPEKGKPSALLRAVRIFFRWLLNMKPPTPTAPTSGALPRA